LEKISNSISHPLILLLPYRTLLGYALFKIENLVTLLAFEIITASGIIKFLLKDHAKGG
jgi:hypothetical protein